MQKKQVAVIDIGSSAITAVVGERGINRTFVIKSRFVFNYEGFESGAFFDVEQVERILFSAVSNIKKVMNCLPDTVYVGVPGDFTQVVVKDSHISFSKKKKILEQDIDALFDSAFVLKSSDSVLINRSAIVYELDDFGRVANPLGAVSEILKGRLSFVLCSSYFIGIVETALKKAGIKKVECVSSALAEALFLVEAEVRDRIVVMADVGYISTTLTIIQGDGLLYQKSFNYGGGYINAAIINKFDVDFDTSEKIKRKVNICSLSTSGAYSLIDVDDGNYYPTEEVKNLILYSLDELCENISDSIEESKYSLPEYVPLYITGGGISYIRGAKEHVSNRLNGIVEIIAPKVPLMDKPTESSLMSLLDLALEQK